MLQQLKRKLISSITEIEVKEDFLYNKWLRVFPTEEITVEEISSQLLDTSIIRYDIAKSFFTEYHFKLKNSELYFENKDYIFKKTDTNPVFFQLLYIPSKVFYHPEIEPKPAGYSAKKIKFLFSSVSQQDIRVKFEVNVSSEYPILLNKPVIKDYLENLKTEIRKIELLKPEELISELGSQVIEKKEVKSFGKLNISKLKVEKIEKVPKIAAIKVPEMGEYKSKVSSVKINALKQSAVSKSPGLKFAAPSVTVGNYFFDQTESVKYYDGDNRDLQVEQNFINAHLQNPDKIKDIISLLLRNTYNVDWEKRADNQIILTQPEEESARFLAQNEYAFLAEELGIDRIKESLAALKFLMISRVIRTALIILPMSLLKNEKYSAEIGNDSGWLNKLKNLCPELSISLIQGVDEERMQNWSNPASVYLVDQNTLKADIQSGILKQNRLAAFDLLIFDEVHYWLDGQETLYGLFKQLKPGMIWALTTFIDDNIINEFNNNLNLQCQIYSSRMKKLAEVDDEQTDITFQEYWLGLDESQQDEYYETVKQCRKDLKRILESENPFRFQANIYTLLHKLYQVENFAMESETSPKTDLLLQHLQSIQHNGRKVIILSQYDKQGTKKIEKFLAKNKINYITAPSSLSGEEIKKAVYLFKNKENITAFLTNVKESRLDFGDMVVPYLIKFDSWWNPAMNMQTKNLFKQNENEKDNKKTFVFYYKVYNAIDELVKKLLFDKNLVKQNIISAMSLNTLNDLISIDEWLEIFGMPVENKSSDRQKIIEATIEKISKLSTKDFQATLSRFFFSLGYSKIDVFEHEDASLFDIAGEGKMGNRSVYLFGRVLLNDVVTRNTINQIIHETSLSKNSNVFIVTRGRFEEGSEKLEKDNVTLIDVNKLSQYLVNMNLTQSEEIEFEEKIDSEGSDQ